MCNLNEVRRNFLCFLLHLHCIWHLVNIYNYIHFVSGGAKTSKRLISSSFLNHFASSVYNVSFWGPFVPGGVLGCIGDYNVVARYQWDNSASPISLLACLWTVEENWSTWRFKLYTVSLDHLSQGSSL